MSAEHDLSELLAERTEAATKFMKLLNATETQRDQALAEIKAAAEVLLIAEVVEHRSLADGIRELAARVREQLASSAEWIAERTKSISASDKPEVDRSTMTSKQIAEEWSADPVNGWRVIGYDNESIQIDLTNPDARSVVVFGDPDPLRARTRGKDLFVNVPGFIGGRETLFDLSTQPDGSVLVAWDGGSRIVGGASAERLTVLAVALDSTINTEVER